MKTQPRPTKKRGRKMFLLLLDENAGSGSVARALSITEKKIKPKQRDTWQVVDGSP